MANQKYGNAPINARTGGRVESNLPLLFQAMMVPKRVPKEKEIIREKPARKIVQRRALEIMFVTGSGKYAIEIPKSPCKMLFK